MQVRLSIRYLFLGFLIFTDPKIFLYVYGYPLSYSHIYLSLLIHSGNNCFCPVFSCYFYTKTHQFGLLSNCIENFNAI